MGAMDLTTPPKSFTTEYASGGSGTFNALASWVQVDSSGTTVLVCEDGTSLTRHSPGAEVIIGSFRSLTSTTSTYLLAGNGVAPPSPAGASNAALYQAAQTAHAVLPFALGTGILAAGTPMAAFADNAASQPGVTLNNSKAVGIRWNNAATQVAVWMMPLTLPLDLDPTAAATFVVMASKTGATSGDATTFTITAFAQTVGALEDAVSDLGGTTTAMTGTATAKTTQRVTLSLAVPPTPPAQLSVSIKPTNGLLGTDDVLVTGFWLEYKRKLQTS